MLHAGLDLSRKRLDVCLVTEDGELAARYAVPPDLDGLRGLAGQINRYGVGVRAVIESMTGARFVLASTPSWRRSGTPARSPTCSARPAASCSSGWSSPSPGGRPCWRRSR